MTVQLVIAATMVVSTCTRLQYYYPFALIEWYARNLLEVLPVWYKYLVILFRIPG